MFLESPPESGEKEKLWQRVLSVAAYLLFWIVLSAIGLWLMFEIEALVVKLMLFAQLSAWAVRGYGQLVIYVLGLIWFIAILWIENYLRIGIGKKRLWRNIAKVAAVQAITVAVVFGIRFLIP